MKNVRVFIYNVSVWLDEIKLNDIYQVVATSQQQAAKLAVARVLDETPYTEVEVVDIRKLREIGTRHPMYQEGLR